MIDIQIRTLPLKCLVTLCPSIHCHLDIVPGKRVVIPGPGIVCLGLQL